MLGIRKELGVFEISEQRLADQARAIRTNGWLSEIELEEIQRNTESDHMEADVRESSGSEDAAQRIELETTDETEEHETAAETDKTVGNELSVQDLCNTLRREGVSEEDIDLVKLVFEEKEKGNTPPDSLRNVGRKTLKQHAAKVSGILKYTYQLKI